MSYHGDIRLGDLPLCGTAVACLRSTIRPTAIVGAVWSVVVDPVDRICWGRFLTHVREEVFERLSPALADCDSTPAVVRPILSISVVAAGADVAPCEPLRTDATLSGHSVSGLTLSGAFVAMASTTDTPAISECRTVNGFLHPTIAAAEPLAPHGATRNCPPTESASGDIVEFWHISNLPEDVRCANVSW